MKQLFLFTCLLACFHGYAQKAKPVTDEEKLNKHVASNVSYFTFDGQRPVGKGWDKLDSLFKNNQFVAWGEYHNSPLLSRLTAYALERAAAYGYRNWCVEVGPYAASELTRISRTPNPADTIVKLFKEGYPNIGVFPFFSNRDDAQMLVAANKFGFNIWGIDQEFQMSFPYGMKDIFQHQTHTFQQRYQSMYDSLQAKWWYPKTALLDSLANVIKQPHYKNLINGIKISKEIYGNGDNAARASLMKENFFRYYNPAVNKKVFFKMGSNHLAKGMNLQTNLYDIGNAVYELSQRNRTGFANVYLMVRYTMEKGKLIDDFVSKDNENPRFFSNQYVTDKWVLIDLRALKMKYDNTLPRDTYQLIEKYDYVLVSPEILNIGSTEN